MDHSSPRIRAARWVIGLGRLYGGLLALLAALSVLALLGDRSMRAAVVAVLVTGCAVAWGALVRAFAGHRRTAWRLLVAVTAVALAWPVGGWLAGRPMSVPTVLSVVLHAGFLGLLQHRDSREWVAVEEPRTETAGRPSIARH